MLLLINRVQSTFTHGTSPEVVLVENFVCHVVEYCTFRCKYGKNIAFLKKEFSKMQLHPAATSLDCSVERVFGYTVHDG